MLAFRLLLFGESFVEAVQERGHVLAVHTGHALEPPRAVRVAVALRDARTTKPLGSKIK